MAWTASLFDPLNLIVLRALIVIGSLVALVYIRIPLNFTCLTCQEVVLSTYILEWLFEVSQPSQRRVADVLKSEVGQFLQGRLDRFLSTEDGRLYQTFRAFSKRFKTNFRVG